MKIQVTYRILALATGLLLPAFSHAGLSFGIGPKGGLNLGNAEISNHDNVGNRTAMSLGATMEFGVTHPFSLLVEPGYVQKGGEFDYATSPISTIHASGKLDYFEIPVLLKAKFGALKAHAYVFAGPSFGINVNAEGHLGTLSDTYKNQATALVFSADGGVGGAVQVQRYIYAMADVRYSYGLNNSLKEKVGDIDSWKNRDIRLQVGLLFHLTE